MGVIRRIEMEMVKIVRLIYRLMMICSPLYRIFLIKNLVQVLSRKLTPIKEMLLMDKLIRIL